jgi:hypothetical protein
VAISTCSAAEASVGLAGGAAESKAVEMAALKAVGLGASLQEASRSRAALAVALDGASAAGATVELLDRWRLAPPIYNPELEPRRALGR